jgi:serine/threonine-protein kinase HipA
MPRDMHGVIWSRISGTPVKMGNLVLSSTETRFTYTADYLSSGYPGFALLADPKLWKSETITYPVSERIPVFPRLLSLIPGNNPRNLQRRQYLNVLRVKSGREPPPGMQTEWELLMIGGHGGIGHIDVFRDDLSASRWYESRHKRQAFPVSPLAGRSELWNMLRREVLDEPVEFDPQIILEALGPTPSVGGMIPKMLVSLDISASENDIYAPDIPGKQNVLLKVEPPEYAGLLDLEALCLEIHREAGFEVPLAKRFDKDGLRMLAIERFDQANGAVLPMESLFSIIAMGNHAFRETGDILLDEIPDILFTLGQVTNLSPDTGEALYRRLLMALLTGNGDMHLDNIAIIGRANNCRLSPVYDPAPMRAWPRHNLVSAIPFDPAGYPNHAAFFVALGSTFKLSKLTVRRCIQEVLEATDSYLEQILSLPTVPEPQKEALKTIVLNERKMLASESP